MIVAPAIALAERGLVPTSFLRRAIGALNRARLEDVQEAPATSEFLEQLASQPVAEVPELANSQHYELPAAFFGLTLGPHLKYSSAVWPEGVSTLAEAEEKALTLTCDRAGIRDGDSILELGCGWGSLSRFMASRYPNSQITAVSNSRPQREHIMAAGHPNLEVVTADMNEFDPGCTFDRIVSVEMFEHMRNWSTLFGRVADWLAPNGSCFIHVFCHRETPYLFDTEGASNWMGQHFFSGGMMPSYDLVPDAASRLELQNRWWLSGENYQATAAAWRENLEGRREEIMPILTAHYGSEAKRWYHRWRLFFLACEELFGFDGGSEWGVGHYRLGHPPSPSTDLR